MATSGHKHSAQSLGEGAAAGDPLQYASSYHAPVLCKAVVEGVVTNRGGVYVDATLGGGGHSAALLEALAPEGRVLGIDQDPDAHTAATARLATERERGRFQLVPGNFSDVEGLLRQAGVPVVEGLLLDLGVSSHQIDTPARGFSFRAEGALDMRMNPDAPYDASDLVNTWSAAELRRIFRVYGEEPRARRIAEAVVAARPLTTTSDLADCVRRLVPAREANKTLARVFQALRIVVNGEMEALEQALDASVRVLKPGGRFAVISYHSLEDRRVKRFFRYGNLEGIARKDLYGNLLTPWELVTRKPIVADAAEVAANPRARSARLRIATRRADASPDGLAT